MERTAGRYLALLLAFVMVLTGSGQVFAVDTADTADSPSEIVEEVAPEESPDSSVLEESIRLDRKLGQVTIQLAADSGMLPAGTELNIEQIKVKGTLAESFLDSRFKNYLVYDISLKDEEGNEVQPDGGVDLSFLNLPFDGPVEVLYLEDRWLEKAKDSKGTFSEPVHDLEVLDTDIASDEVVVTTDHFSIYVVGEYSLATYQFNADNVFISEQVVKNGDLLVEPASPNKEGHKFTGWYVEGEDSPIDFSEPVAFSNDEDFKLQVYAGFTAVYYVYFIYDGDIVTTKEVVPGETTDAHDITLIVSEPGWALDYWSVTENGQPFDFANTPINENLKLYAVTVEGWEVYFNTQGGTQVLPKYIPFNQPKENQIGTFQLPTPPTRQGYTFLRWNDKADGTGNNFGAGTLINSSHVDGQGVLHLYAIWQGQTGISYSLVYWQENADDDGYSYVATVGRTGRAGNTIVVADADRRPNRYTYFSYKGYDSNVRIKGDGSA
ncbi:MAG TPA: InlB B-repeat-containing protein, partial [Clostridiaceae bacterium]|nr:InlB B-repeat-containing protein [Clostridiaceae bacterium]